MIGVGELGLLVWGVWVLLLFVVFVWDLWVVWRLVWYLERCARVGCYGFLGGFVGWPNIFSRCGFGFVAGCGRLDAG